eukprot:TRINITY_DN3402_c0_g1_i1.p1 TRINITY_DN3402_c0_g1~~TRINITY_DN3402_c0_g1_i1.p1  ORF type:complete len:233 (+),score=52.55 TRINITY_DN3402_c0_g1_i1:53-751(+)
MSHNKSVDSPQLHRTLKKEVEMNQHKQMEGNFRIGESVQHVEPDWKSSQRYGRHQYGTDGGRIIGGDPVSPQKSPQSQRRVYDTSANTDWNGSTGGSSVQKVVDEKKAVHVHNGWHASSCSKTVEENKKHYVVEKEPLTIPNEKRRTIQRNDWMGESAKTIEQEKRQLDLAPKNPPPAAPKPIVRPEDWDSNLKTLPNCSKQRGVVKTPHTYDDIKDSVVPHEPRGGSVRNF